MLHIDPKSQTPIYEQIIVQMKDRVAKGVLKPGERIPPVRELSSQIVVNPNTVSKAYKELEKQGVIVTMRGRGTFISEDVTAGITAGQTEHVKKEMSRVVLDAYYAGVSKEELHVWINAFYDDLGGWDK
ncbi:GntR family transcriptional regulator [Salsuginibacillus halophilus]|uniref:GntR family transcriptional regulator n=1 Tax=Salsuginibacillus halophilus TaxID=517424 RepID=A0A2P8HBG6_9BACI|nr:GntR family transcriptional regulator [Salsuginibacillus halophilus]PSL43558.1 GntR family transcriptional regulator [Salsuginibacillus halophilus]